MAGAMPGQVHEPQVQVGSGTPESAHKGGNHRGVTCPLARAGLNGNLNRRRRVCVQSASTFQVLVPPTTCRRQQKSEPHVRSFPFSELIGYRILVSYMCKLTESPRSGLGLGVNEVVTIANFFSC
jgi:hypothetical protein